MSSLIDILKQAGFSGPSLQTAYAIAMAESGGNARAFNGNAKTGDKSFGLFQINMLGGMGPERRRQFGLSADDDLYDELTNAKVAYKLSQGGTNWGPWSTYNNGAYRKYLGQTGASVSGSAAKNVGAGGAAAENNAPPQADFLRSTIAPGLVSDTGDPFAPNQTGDPVATPKPGAATPAQNMATGGSGSTSFRDKIIATAMQKLGTPYSWGGGGLNGASRGFAQGAGTVGFDCSSLMMYAFGKNGYSLPRVSFQQLAQGVRTSVAGLKPGDLVGFRDGSHVALYIGGGRILEAPRTGLSVRVRSLGANEDAFGVHLTLPGD